MTLPLLRLTDIPSHHLKDKIVLIREDFNVPIEKDKSGNFIISHDARLIAALPTLQYVLSYDAKIVLISHLGRPKEGEYDESLSLLPVAKKLSEYLKEEVIFLKEGLDSPDKIKSTFQSARIILLENIRFNIGEKSNNEALAKKLANLCDIFVMDAFATAHRAEASTVGIAQLAKIACAGLLLVKELEALDKALKNPKHPLIAIVGGSKVSTKLTTLETLIDKVDGLILGGGIANTFLAAKGIGIGKSLYEEDLIPDAVKIMALATQKSCEIYLPSDVLTAKTFSAEADASLRNVQAIFPDEMILDIGPETSKQYHAVLKKAGTIIWNGPVGVFEFPAFSQGTRALAEAIAESSAFSLAGGGDTLSAIDQFHITNKISYISTGGGAFLEFIEGKTLPAIDILEKRAQS